MTLWLGDRKTNGAKRCRLGLTSAASVAPKLRVMSDHADNPSQSAGSSPSTPVAEDVGRGIIQPPGHGLGSKLDVKTVFLASGQWIALRTAAVRYLTSVLCVATGGI
jgi:hypothetical protein